MIQRSSIQPTGERVSNLKSSMKLIPVLSAEREAAAAMEQIKVMMTMICKETVHTCESAIQLQAN